MRLWARRYKFSDDMFIFFFISNRFVFSMRLPQVGCTAFSITIRNFTSLCIRRSGMLLPDVHGFWLTAIPVSDLLLATNARCLHKAESSPAFRGSFAGARRTESARFSFAAVAREIRSTQNPCVSYICGRRTRLRITYAVFYARAKSTMAHGRWSKDDGRAAVHTT